MLTRARTFGTMYSCACCVYVCCFCWCGLCSYLCCRNECCVLLCVDKSRDFWDSLAVSVAMLLRVLLLRSVLTSAETFRITIQLCVDKRSRDTWDHLTMYAADTDAIFVVFVYVCRRRETGATSPWCWIVSSSSSSPPPTCVGPSPSFSMPLRCTTDAST